MLFGSEDNHHAVPIMPCVVYGKVVNHLGCERSAIVSAFQSFFGRDVTPTGGWRILGQVVLALARLCTLEKCFPAFRIGV